MSIAILTFFAQYHNQITYQAEDLLQKSFVLMFLLEASIVVFLSEYLIFSLGLGLAYALLALIFSTFQSLKRILNGRFWLP